MDLLGKTVRDTVSGLTGIADQYLEHLTGTRQYSIQPKGDGTTIPQGYSIDENQVEIVADGPTIPVVPADTSVTIQLGDEIEDIISGFRGTSVRKTTFLNGCVFFDADGAYNHQRETAKIMFGAHGRFKVVKPQHFQTMKTAAAETTSAPPQARTGGPMARSRRI